ncbi:heavy metal translocating P-type ATPase [Bifidobacterium adolescentis]|uniref:heavy metal translocating P-type ATPase n=1 Tax=Bifidobacterium adolescentis TaxID=1680 RepID=UPI00189E9F14|nr:heavy metal translocating P-type ATPase [Bifidobacterium adolescentis]MDB0656318.1 heavy metal translocating P-type ATPase [Bifidobacterium adolescentis]MDB0661055.1 heavy metal translocating P-type ATPase [Bifidobacterium adolescentis]MDB0662755.1 heavy metal translocating P-type ATPase [Bifidobacterium adolescentis]MDB1344733.1 heavy metal translocating P-type ATPase [Bifidobacterium adolescentis]MDB1347391.1 heavy metal translocating P-type ATPase [Bifidobacterium adolescentis]
MRRIISICKEVPLLPIAIIAAIPLALLGSWRPWEAAGVSLTFGPFNPGVGQWIVIALVVYTIVVTVIGMIDDLRHGHVGVDLLAVIAIASTVAVQEYWAAWAVVLMISSGEAIEEFAQSKAEGNLTALVDAAPRTAHVVTLPGVRGHVHTTGGEHAADVTEGGFRKVAGAGDSGVGGSAAYVSVSGESDKPGTKPYDAAGEHFETVPVDQVKLGDVILVLPGETVPVDGELLSGVATLDLSNINGEPVPREVYAGARVLSGAVNGSTALTMRATQLAQDSQYQKILELVSSAQQSRPTVVKTADVLAVPFTILSLAIAGIAWAVAGTPLRFAQVLVLATPCPLLIAAPVAYVAGTGRLAKAGILIKAQDVLENLGRVSHIFFDKTGTLTVKQPQVVRVEKPFENSSPYDENHILMMAGVVEGYSVHILSKGIAAAGQKAMQELYARYENGQRLCAERDLPGHGRDYPVVKNIEEQSGKGVSGEVNGHAVRVGRFAYVTADEAGFTHVLGAGVAAGTAAGAVADSAVGDSATGTAAGASKKPEVNSLFAPLEPDEMAAYVAIDGKLAARIVLRDVPRENAKASLEKLHRLGVKKLSMLTGDKEASARIIAGEVGIDDVQSELFPEGKVAAVKNATEDAHQNQPAWDKVVQRVVGESMTRQVTMMVGDGVNDAPVLAVADIGMAMTDGTSTAASESAQVVIMNDDIASVPRAIAIARRTKKVMLQAVLVGLGLAIIGMVAAAFNLIPVVVGAFMQEAIDVVSILWALTALLDRE